MNVILRKSFFICCGLLLSACETTVHTRGNYLMDKDLKRVEIGKTSQEDLIKALGEPSYKEQYAGKGLFYIGEVRTQQVFFKPTIVDRKVITFHFDASETLKSIDIKDLGSARDVQYNETQTPAKHSDPSLLSEMFKGVGMKDEGRKYSGRQF